MIKENDHMIPRKDSNDENTKGVEVKMMNQREKEKKGRFVKAGIIDIKMRMLRIAELKRIMGFPEDYILVGPQSDQKKFIGNAVEVNMARVLCEAICKEIIRKRKVA